jgi:hypothetical protein
MDQGQKASELFGLCEIECHPHPRHLINDVLHWEQCYGLAAGSPESCFRWYVDSKFVPPIESSQLTFSCHPGHEICVRMSI